MRAFTFGHVRQLEKLLAETLTRAWRAGAGPGDERLIVDVDSFVGDVHGYQKEGVGFGYTKRRGYHPMLASRADTGEVLHVRLHKGSAASPRGVVRFVDELIARVKRAGASGEKLLRADLAFWNKQLIARLERAGWRYSISVRLRFWVADAVAAIPESAWQPLADYPPDGEAQIAETTVKNKRLIVRRTRLIGAQAQLWPDWRYFPFLTNRNDPLELVESEHRQHAVVELTIRDLKDQAPSLLQKLLVALLALERVAVGLECGVGQVLLLHCVSLPQPQRQPDVVVVADACSRVHDLIPVFSLYVHSTQKEEHLRGFGVLKKLLREPNCLLHAFGLAVALSEQHRCGHRAHRNRESDAIDLNARVEVRRVLAH